MVKLLACGAKGPGFDSPPRHLNFRDWLYLLLPSRDMAEIPLKRVNPQYNQPTTNYRDVKLVVLGINVDLAIFQPYISTWKQEITILLKFKWRGRESNPGSSCSASQELNHSATYRCSNRDVKSLICSNRNIIRNQAYIYYIPHDPMHRVVSF